MLQKTITKNESELICKIYFKNYSQISSDSFLETTNFKKNDNNFSLTTTKKTTTIFR
ncbi:ORF_52 [Adoxophyes orana granulovirus]|uniref:ORF_52 n=1 Tax=Adoxophyes orana granulovirus TaxID=170617 RepID=Q7T9W3_GVAO|nr:ORF_52 [Adoxophyes orana granulovirus]AAP85689.1 ORF_52 [Adoxophyes orana granulovirus]